MEQLFATFYPKTKRIPALVPRSQQYILTAQKKSQSAHGQKRHSSFSGTRQDTWMSQKTNGNEFGNKENTQTKHSMNFDDYILDKYEEQQKKKKQIHPFAVKKLQQRDISNAVESYKNFNTEKSKELQNDLSEQHDSTFFGKNAQNQHQHSPQNKLNSYFDLNEKQNTSPNSKNNKSEQKINRVQNEGIYQPRYTEVDEEHNNSSTTSKRVGSKGLRLRTPNHSEAYKNIQFTQNSNSRTNEHQRTSSKYQGNYDNNSDQDKDDRSFEDFYVTLQHQHDYSEMESSNKPNPNESYNNNNHQQIEYSPSKKQNEDLLSLSEQNKDIKKSKNYPFFITKINILDQPNIYDVLSDKKNRTMTEPNQNGSSGGSHQPTYLKGFIKHDIHYIQSKNLRAALSAAAKKRQNTSHSSQKSPINYPQITNSALNGLPKKETHVQFGDRLPKEQQLANNFKLSSKKIDSTSFRKNTHTYDRDRLGYSDMKQGQNFNDMYENYAGNSTHNTLLRKTRDYRITKSSQGQRTNYNNQQDDDEDGEGQVTDLLERLNSYNHEKYQKLYQLPHQNHQTNNTKSSPMKRNHTSQQKHRFSDNLSRVDGTPHSNIHHSPSRVKTPLNFNDQVVEFNQSLTVQRFLKKVKTPNSKLE